MTLTAQHLNERTCSPLRERNIQLAQEWVEQPVADVQHSERYSIVRFANCPHKPKDRVGGFAVKVFDDRLEATCFHDKCQGHDFEENLGPCPIREKPWFLPAEEFGRKHSQHRESVIHGVIDRGDVANVIAASKLGKSYFMLQQALSVAAGIPWCGFSTEQGNVLIIDNELHPDTIWRRLESVREAMDLDKGVLERVSIASLRGNLIGLDELCDRIRRLPKNDFSLIIFDALYRMLPRGCDENGNADVTQLYNTLDAAATTHGCAIAVVHHSSKGDQSKKSVTDVGSGAGSQSRAADCHMVLRPHANLGSVIMQAAVRAHAPIEPVVLRREHPLWVVDDSADATQVRTVRPLITVDEFNDWLEPGEYVVSELESKIRSELEQTRDNAESLVKQAIDRGLVTLVSTRRNEKRRIVKS